MSQDSLADKNMPQNPLNDPQRPKLLEKKFRVILDFTATVNDIGTVPIRQPMEAAWLRFAAETKVQRRLLHALLSHPPTLNRLLRSYSFSAIESYNIPHEESYDILAPVIATLAPDEIQFLKEAQENELFTENTSQFDSAIELSDPVITFEGLPLDPDK